MKDALLWLVVLLAGCRVEPTAPATTGSERAAGEADGRRTDDRRGSPDDTIAVVRVPSGMPPVGPSAVGMLYVGPAGLALPVAGVRPADLVDTFDDARSEGRVHDAIDIPAPRGTPVVAAAAGTVARLFTSDRGGLTVYVLGPDERTVFYYAHLDAYTPGLAAGQSVARGAALGTVGSTGNASPDAPHLHFAVWRAESAASFWDGEAVNPYPLLAGR